MSHDSFFTHDTKASKVRLQREVSGGVREVTVAIAAGYSRMCPECGGQQLLELRTTYGPGDNAMHIYDQPKCARCRGKPKAK
jgi:hypothetical protein